MRVGGCGRLVLGSTASREMKSMTCFLLSSTILRLWSVVSWSVPFLRTVSAIFSVSVVPKAFRSCSSETRVPLLASENIVSAASTSVIEAIFPLR